MLVCLFLRWPFNTLPTSPPAPNQQKIFLIKKHASKTRTPPVFVLGVDLGMYPCWGLSQCVALRARGKNRTWGDGFCLVCPWISSPLPPMCSGNFGVEIWDFVQCIFYCYFAWPFCLSFLVCHWWLQMVYDWPLFFKLCSWWNYCELFYGNLMEDCERSCLSTRYC